MNVSLNSAPIMQFSVVQRFVNCKNVNIFILLLNYNTKLFLTCMF